MNLNNVAALAARKQMIPNAPVQAQGSVEIEAAPAAVWAILTDVSQWPRWYPYLRNAKLYGPFQAGTRLVYGGLFKHDLHIALVDAPRLVMIYGTLTGYTAITRWDFAQVDHARTQVTFTESSDGPLIGWLYSNEKLRVHLLRWLDKLKAEVERKRL